MRNSNILIKICQILLYLTALTPIVLITTVTFPYITTRTVFFRIIVEIVLILFLWLILKQKIRIENLKKNYFFWIFLAFFSVEFFAAIFGQSFIASFFSDFERMWGLFTVFNLFLFYCFLRTFFADREWKIFFHLSFAVSIFVSIYGILQRYPDIFHIGVLGSGTYRIASTLGNPTYVAMYLLFNVGFAVYYLCRNWKEYNFDNKKFDLLSYFYIGTILIDLYGFWLANMRGTTLGLMAGTAAALILYIILGKSKGLRIGFAVILILGILSVGFAFLNKESNLVKNIPLLNRFAHISLQETTAQTRIIGWKAAYLGVKEKPFTGVGMENYDVLFNKHFPAQYYSLAPTESYFDRAHNQYINIAAESGILALLIYLCFPIFIGWYLVRGYKYNFKFQISNFKMNTHPLSPPERGIEKKSPLPPFTKGELENFSLQKGELENPPLNPLHNGGDSNKSPLMGEVGGGLKENPPLKGESQRRIDLPSFIILAGISIAYFVHILFVFDDLTSAIYFCVLIAFIEYLYYKNNIIIINPPYPPLKRGNNPDEGKLNFVWKVLIILLIIITLFAIYNFNYKIFKAAKLSANAVLSAGFNEKENYYNQALNLGIYNPYYLAFDYAEYLNSLTNSAADFSKEDKEKVLTSSKNVEENLNKLKEIKPASITIYLTLAQLADLQFILTDDKAYLDKAIENLKIAQDLSPQRLQVFYGLGETYVLMKEYQKAIDILTEAQNLNPDFGTTNYYLGRAYLEKGDYDTAYENIVQKAVIEKNYSPEQPNFLSRLAEHYFKQADYEKAKTIYGILYEMNPENADIAGSLTVISIKTGDFEGAKEYAKRAGQLDSAYAEEAQSIIDMINAGEGEKLKEMIQ